ncbi:MAG TPA: hypothetical protein VE645_18855, partial [Pseudonocardiaceae bacterium]|nr:hypothetical protein [Pseudonocardiaceae bacterium]
MPTNHATPRLRPAWLLPRDGTPPVELRTAGREEVVKYGGEVIKDRARGHRAHRRAGDGQLHSVELADGQAVSRAAVFIGPRFVPHDELLTSLGCQVDD